MEPEAITSSTPIVPYHTHNGIDSPVVASTIITNTGAPAVTPRFIGQIYVDTANSKVYISTGITSSTDFKILN